MNYKTVMTEVNELDRIIGWTEDFRFQVEVAIDNNFDHSAHMGISDFIDMCVEIAGL